MPGYLAGVNLLVSRILIMLCKRSKPDWGGRFCAPKQLFRVWLWHKGKFGAQGATTCKGMTTYGTAKVGVGYLRAALWKEAKGRS